MPSIEFIIDCTGCGQTHSARYPSHPLEVRAHAKAIRKHDRQKRAWADIHKETMQRIDEGSLKPVLLSLRMAREINARKEG